METLERVIGEARGLKPHELKRLREAVDEMLATGNKPLMTEDEFERYLATRGVITLPEDTAEDDDDWEPVEVTGKPLSEMIVDERR